MTDSTIDLDAFKRFEQAGWSDTHVSRTYEAGLCRVTVQAVGPLLAAVGVRPGIRLLDVATGPGEVAAAAQAAGAIVTGVDFSAAMIAMARQRHPGIEFREGDAEALPFADGEFDGVVMSYGLLHLARPERGVAEAWRILRPGGRFAFSMWAPPDPTNGFGMILGAIRAHGNLDVPVPPGPPLFRFSDRDESTRALEDAGFVDIEVEDIEQTWHLPSADALLAEMAEGSVRTRALIGGQTPAELTAILAGVREAGKPYLTAAGVAIPMPAILAVGRKPSGARRER